MKVLVFGMLVEDTGNDVVELVLPPDTETLRRELIYKFPSLQNRQFFIAVNQQKADHNIMLGPDDEIALIPPFAGG
jgi:molybdopterin converting factor small subunit